MAVDIKQYAEELFKAAGVSDDTVKQAVTNFLSNETVAKRLGDDILRQQDYSRNMDAIKAQEKKNSDYYQTLVTWKEQQDATVQPQQVVQQVQPDFAALEKKFGDRLTQQEGQFISLLKTGMNLASRHAVEFKEPLDATAVEKIAAEKQLPLAQAYDEYVAPRRADAAKAQREAERQADRADAVREFASKNKIPVDTQPREGAHLLFDRSQVKPVVTDYKPGTAELSQDANSALSSSFADAWNSATSRAGTSG